MFGRIFIIPMEQQGFHSWFFSELTKYELIALHFIFIPHISHIDSKTEIGTILDNLLSYSITWKTIGHAIDQ